MSGLDQSLLIATTGYHVGHQRSIRVAEEQGFFQEEGFTDYIYDYRGLIPGPLEREGLALAMKEHGVDIACGANVDSVVRQREKGEEDLFIVAGWRYMTRPKVVSAKNITRIEHLKGKKIGLRELGGLSDRLIIVDMIKAGMDPEKDVEWVMDPVFAYPDSQEHADMLRQGKVDAMTTSGGYARQLVEEGYNLLLDGGAPERRRRPGRAIVATRQTIEHRGEELVAFLRANLRAFWFWGDPGNFDYLYDLETRMREKFTHNEHERHLRIVRRAPSMEDSLMPLDGAVDAKELQYVIDEMQLLGEVNKPLKAEDMLRGEFMERGFRELCERPALKATAAKVVGAMNAK